MADKNVIPQASIESDSGKDLNRKGFFMCIVQIIIIRVWKYFFGIFCLTYD